MNPHLRDILTRRFRIVSGVDNNEKLQGISD